MALVKRAERQHYMNTGTSSAPVWSLIGEGFTDFTESKNAVSYQRRYIHEATKRTDVTGYAPVIDYELEVYKNNPVIEKIRKITDLELTGDEEYIRQSEEATPLSPTNAARVRTHSATPAR